MSASIRYMRSTLCAAFRQHYIHRYYSSDTGAVNSHPSYKTLLVEAPAPHVIHVRLSRPDKRNAITAQAFQELRECFERIDQCSHTRAVVLSGEGTVFSAGLDFQDISTLINASTDWVGLCGQASQAPVDIARRAKGIRKVLKQWQNSLTTIAECSKPVVAAVNGPCIGGGLEVAIACDIRYCSRDSYFSIREVTLGMAADVGSLQRVPKVMGNDSLMRELAFTGLNKCMSTPLQRTGSLTISILMIVSVELALELSKRLQPTVRWRFRDVRLGSTNPVILGFGRDWSLWSPGASV
ncbi:unnamed protein product [Oppiella nova]|uniref:3-hydroxyisobutyryl-CoA hydrolase n=1 Tax=Oppiella nova TaxID=334625 RepID=A0A7R9M4C8_9ACAR|nr:unnamed protein product [Oppiella nova]CAG2169358.1 unnamed protein product [Oppiella nova]